MQSRRQTLIRGCEGGHCCRSSSTSAQSCQDGAVAASEMNSAPSTPPWHLVACLLILARTDGSLTDEGVGAGADRVAYGGQPAADMPEALSHLSNALDRRAATEGTEFVELTLLADGQPVIMDSPIYLKYQDLYHLDLWEAAKTGDVNRLKELLDEGHAIDERQDGATPMYWAQYYLQSEAMEFLLQRGADANAKELVLPPHTCSHAPSPQAPSHCVLSCQTGGFYPLHAAAFHKEDCIGCARLLLAAGARLDVHWVRLPPCFSHSAHKLLTRAAPTATTGSTR